MSFDAKLTLWAVAVQALLSIVIAFAMAVARGRDIVGGLDPQSVALREQNWSRRAAQVSNNYLNQFELPVLFYVVCLLFLFALRPDLIAAILAWVFVVSRIAHAVVHMTSNVVRVRGAFWGIGLLALLLMWLYFVFLLATLPG